MRTMFVLLLLAAAPATAPADPKPAPKPVAVPFTLLPSRHMLIEAKVNGKGPYKLIFDTGAPINLMSTRLGKDAGLITKGGGFSLFGGLTQMEVPSLQLGGVTVEKVPAVVMDHPTVQAISDAFRRQYGIIDGIVGFPFFARFTTTIDYQKKQLSLTPNGYKPGDYLQDLTQTLMAATEKAGKPRVVGGAGLWGLEVDRPAGDELGGVRVVKVFDGSPSAVAGLKAEDRVLTIDGRWTDTVPDTYLAASLVKPGRAVEVTLLRDGKKMTRTVTPTRGL